MCRAIRPKRGHRVTTIICQFLTDLRKFFIGRFSGKFAVKWTSKTPPYLAYVATYNLVKHECQQNKPLTTTYKVYSVARYLRCGGDFNSHIKEDLLLSL